MIRIVDLPFRHDLVRECAELVEGGVSARDAAVVFPGTRPAHHLTRELSRLAGGPCYAPTLLTIPQLIQTIAGCEEQEPAATADLVYVLSEVIARSIPGPLGALAANFAAFYPWGTEFVRAIDELDRDLVTEKELQRLQGVEGYEQLLELSRAFHDRLPEIRARYHEELLKRALGTYGVHCMTAVRRLEAGHGPMWKTIVFGGIFALTRGEREVVRRLGESSEVIVVRQVDGRAWGALRELEEALAVTPERHAAPPGSPGFELHAAPSCHGEVLQVGAILHRTGADLEHTTVVLPEAAALMPLLWEVMTTLDVDYNLTMGYPFDRTPVYALLDQAMRVVERSSEDGRVPVPGYLELMLHPYVKNLALGGPDASWTRRVLHAVEEGLGKRGEPFCDLKELESDAAAMPELARGADEQAAPGELLESLHRLFIRPLRDARTLGDLALALDAIVVRLADQSPAREHPLFHDVFARASDSLDELRRLQCATQQVEDHGLLHRLVRTHFQDTRIPFVGLPLRGLQVMGLLETRCLNFDTVVVLDVNEGVIPDVSRQDAVLPPAFRKTLGLPGYREHVEVYKYNLFRLVGGAATAHLIYREGPETTRSHFIDELVLQARRDHGRLEEVPVARLAFSSGPADEPAEPFPGVPKDSDVLERLRGLTYSALAFDEYLTCPMLFYNRRVLDLRQPAGLDDEFDPADVGRRLHECLRGLYGDHAGKILDERCYDQMRSRVDQRCAESFPGGGYRTLLRQVASHRLGSLLDREREQLGGRTVRLMEVESKIEAEIRVGRRTLHGVARLDRIEERDGMRVIVDYKSGKDLERLLPKLRFDGASERRDILRGLCSVQMPFYVEVLHQCQELPYDRIQAELVSLRAPSEDPVPLFREAENRTDRMQNVYRPCLESIVEEIFDPDRPFSPDPADPDTCATCPFATLCRKSGARPGREA